MSARIVFAEFLHEDRDFRLAPIVIGRRPHRFLIDVQGIQGIDEFFQIRRRIVRVHEQAIQDFPGPIHFHLQKILGLVPR